MRGRLSRKRDFSVLAVVVALRAGRAERVGRPAELAGHLGVGVAVRDVVTVDRGVAAVGISVHTARLTVRWEDAKDDGTDRRQAPR
jgi:hypothetical protein